MPLLSCISVFSLSLSLSPSAVKRRRGQGGSRRGVVITLTKSIEATRRSSRSSGAAIQRSIVCGLPLNVRVIYLIHSTTLLHSLEFGSIALNSTSQSHVASLFIHSFTSLLAFLLNYNSTTSRRSNLTSLSLSLVISLVTFIY